MNQFTSFRTFVVLTASVIVVACYNNYPVEDFEEFCEGSLSIKVYDEPAWKNYLEHIRISDYRHRAEYPKDRDRWPNYVSLYHQMYSLSEEGFTTQNDFSLGTNFRPEPLHPYRNFQYIYFGQKKIATVTNYDVSMRGMDTRRSDSCLLNYYENLKIPIMSGEEYRNSVSNAQRTSD